MHYTWYWTSINVLHFRPEIVISFLRDFYLLSHMLHFGVFPVQSAPRHPPSDATACKEYVLARAHRTSTDSITSFLQQCAKQSRIICVNFNWITQRVAAGCRLTRPGLLGFNSAWEIPDLAMAFHGLFSFVSASQKPKVYHHLNEFSLEQALWPIFSQA